MSSDTPLIEELRAAEEHTPLAYDSELYRRAADRIEELRQQIVERDAMVERMREALEDSYALNVNVISEMDDESRSYYSEYKAVELSGRSALALTPSTALAEHDAEVLANLLHYPQCWDTAAYPTFEDALHEFKATGCPNDDHRMAKEG